MRQDASVECGTEDHESITDLAIGFIVLWPAGSLVLFTSLLAGRRGCVGLSAETYED